MRELDVERIVEAELLSQARNRFGVGALADHLLDWVARGDVQQQKDDHQYAGERWDCEEQTAEEKRRHLRL